MTSRAALLFLASSLAAVACDDRAARDAAGLVAAVDNFHAADSGYKAAAAKAVEAATCSATDVCAAKQACLDAIEPTVQGIALDDDVKKALDAIESTQPPDPTLAPMLADKAKRARALLDKGHDAMHACDERTVALRVKYHVP
jgi:hypothetical protein